MNNQEVLNEIYLNGTGLKHFWQQLKKNFLDKKVNIEDGKRLITTEEINKLAGIEATAEVNVQADWGETDSTKDSFILRKPNFILNSEKGISNGVATLDSNGIIPSSQLPAYVDDVLEYSTQASFPITGETGKIYVDLSTNLTYRWGGTAYVEISQSLALGETSSTAYAGDKGKTAYDHATENKINGPVTSGLYKVAATA